MPKRALTATQVAALRASARSTIGLNPVAAEGSNTAQPGDGGSQPLNGASIAEQLLNPPCKGIAQERLGHNMHAWL